LSTPKKLTIDIQIVDVNPIWTISVIVQHILQNLIVEIKSMFEIWEYNIETFVGIIRIIFEFEILLYLNKDFDISDIQFEFDPKLYSIDL
jgi:hypothetical protein